MGPMHDASITIKFGVLGNLFGTTFPVTFTPSSFQFGHNNLMTVDSSDALYGAMQTFNLSDSYLVDDLSIGTGIGGDNQYHFGNNTITTGKGANVLYSAVQDFNLSTTNGTNVASDLFDFSTNHLTTGSGATILYGSAKNFSLSISGAFGAQLQLGGYLVPPIFDGQGNVL